MVIPPCFDGVLISGHFLFLSRPLESPVLPSQVFSPDTWRTFRPIFGRIPTSEANKVLYRFFDDLSKI